jgi:hypothetical protein
MLQNVFLHNLRMGQINYRVCPWQAFPMFASKAKSLPENGVPERCHTRGGSGFNGTARFKNVNNALNTNIYSYLETSGGQSSNPYLNVVHFFNTRVN